jgi:hypothetical protein
MIDNSYYGNRSENNHLRRVYLKCPTGKILSKTAPLRSVL